MSQQEATPNPDATKPGRTTRVDRRLLALNGALLGILAFVTWTGAQPPAAPVANPRGPGQYTMVAGRVLGSSTHAVYILDSSNHEMAAIMWDRNKNQFGPLGYRNFANDAVYMQPAR